MTARHNSLNLNMENYNLKRSLQTTRLPRLSKKTATILVAVFAIFLSFPVMADQPVDFEYSNRSFFDAFANDDIVNVTIETNITDLIENRKRDEYLPATMKWKDASGIWNTFEVGVMPRGKFRRRICDFPPVKIKLSKDELKASGFAKYNKLKLVTHCIDDKNEGNSNLLREYLAYKMYNELTDNSFRVQLVKITYIDNVGDYGKETRYGFIIESKKELSNRLGGKEAKDCFNPDPSTIVNKDLGIASVFQYMIGNGDWDIPMNKNITMVKLNNSSKLVPVPYDFDFAGIVNADYAIPNPNYGLISTQDRVYLGTELNNNQMRATLEYFQSKRKDLNKVIKSIKPLKYDDEQEIYAFMNQFYQEVDLLLKMQNRNIYEVLKSAHINSIHDQALGANQIGK